MSDTMKNKRFSSLLILLGFFSALSIGFAVPSQASIDKNECHNAAPKDNKWSEAEKWVWKNLCEQKEADLNEYIKSLQEQFKKNDNKKISADFLMEILTNENYGGKLPVAISIKGANFDGEIDLRSQDIKKEVNLIDSTFNNLVNLSYSNFAKSLNFESSEFKRKVIFNDAIVGGTLSFTKAKFDNQNSSDKCKLLDLARTQVGSDLYLKETQFSCNLNEEDKNNESIYVVDLKATKIKVSVYITSVKLNSNNFNIDEFVLNVMTPKIERGISLVAAEVGDAVIIDQTFYATKLPDQYSQINVINMINIKAKALVSYVDPELAKKISDYRIFQLFNSEWNTNETSSFENYLSQFVVNLENANIGTINIEKVTEPPVQTDNSPDNDSFQKGCKVRLNGFNYNQVNKIAYKFLTICIDSLYREAITLTNNAQTPEEHESANDQLVQLLQPIQKLATVSKTLGISNVEQEMMYRQKKLEYYIALTNLNNSKSNIINNIYTHPNNNILLALWSDSNQAIFLSWNLLSNVVQDITYGYGFKRLIIFRLIIIFLGINFFLALFVSYKKQGKIAFKSLECRENEIRDEKLITRSEAGIFDMQSISTKIDGIVQVIFDKCERKDKFENIVFFLYLNFIDKRKYKVQEQKDKFENIIYFLYLKFIEKQKNKVENMIFFLYLKFIDNGNDKYKNGNDKYKKIQVNSQEFKYLIEILDSRCPLHTKIGFCQDYYPRGNWSVALRPSGSKLIDLSELKSIDLYLIHEQKLIKNVEFEFIDPLPFNPLPLLQPVFKSISVVFKKIRDKDMINMLIRKPKFGYFLLFIESLSLILVISIVIILLIFFFSSAPVLFIWGWFSRLQTFFFLLISILLFSKIFVFWRHRTLQQDNTPAIVIQKNLENAILFSLDVVIPIIELDQDNLNFILDAAEDYFWIRSYFRSQKVLGPVIIGILLPLLFF